MIVRNFKPLSLYVFFLVLARERMITKTRSIESRSYWTRKYTVCRRVRASFSPEIFTGWGSEGVKRVMHFMSSGWLAFMDLRHTEPNLSTPPHPPDYPPPHSAWGGGGGGGGEEQGKGYLCGWRGREQGHRLRYEE